MAQDNRCEACGGAECSTVHIDVMACPVCHAEYDEFTKEFGLVFDELMRRADRRNDRRQFAGELAIWLEDQAASAATGSRDFGRGFMLAARLLRQFRA